MPVWIVPISFAGMCSVLALATHLEVRRVQVMVRMTIRARTTSPEQVEALAAEALAPVLAAHGFERDREQVTRASAAHPASRHRARR